MARANITNKDISEKLSLDHTTVSRYRSGDRRPSLDIIIKIAEEFNWDMSLQALSLKNNVWHEGFEARLVDLYGEVADDAPAEATSD